jgi:hypothetical protein
MDARMRHVLSYAGAPTLNAANAVVALPQCEVLLSTITIDTPGAEMIRMLGTIIQAELGNVPTTLANMALVESRLNYLSERMTRMDALAMGPSERVDLLVTEHAEAHERHNASPRVPPSDEDSLVGGYVRAYDQALQIKLNSNGLVVRSGVCENRV